MLWAAATTCFFGFLRSGEIVVPGESGFDPTVHLAHGDVKVSSYEDPSFVEVTIKASKTDPYRQGVKVYGQSSRRPLPSSNGAELYGRAR